MTDASPTEPEQAEAGTDGTENRSDDARNQAKTGTSARTEPDDGERPPAPGPATTEDGAKPSWYRDRRKIRTGAGVLAAAAAVGAAVLLLTRTGETSAPEPERVAVTYKVTGEGTASLTFNAGTAGEPAEQEQSAELPWSKKLKVDPKSGPARVSVILGKDGGRAQCTLAVRGEHRQRATAFGEFGRATCSAEVSGASRQGAAAPEPSR